MKKNVHMQMNDVVFLCASCGNKFNIKSTLIVKETTVDVCSMCHPFYIGTNTGQQVKGRAEKFNKKIVTEEFVANNKKENRTAKKSAKTIVKSLRNL